MPLAWLAWRAAADGSGGLGSWKLAGATAGLAGLAALVGLVLGLVPGIVLGAGSGTAARALWLPVAVAAVTPSTIIAYGWSQVLRMLELVPRPGSWADVVRATTVVGLCVWPVGAAICAWGCWRVSGEARMSAALDGGHLRMIGGAMARPALVAWLAMFILAGQEFAIFEQTGIVTSSTEVRLVFETGLGRSGVVGVMGSAEGAMSQEQRAAAAIRAGLPTLLIIMLAGLIIWRVLRNDDVDHADTLLSPKSVQPPRSLVAISWGLALLVLLAPILAAWASLRRPLQPVRIAQEFLPQLAGSAQLGLAASFLVAVVAMAALAWRPRWSFPLTIAAFLVGGQFLAIAMIRLLNRPFPFGPVDLSGGLYDSPLGIIATFTGRFAWIGIMAAALSWRGGLGALRDSAATDGASSLQTATRVVLPNWWPVLAGALLLVLGLCMGDTAVSTLMAPLRPPMLMPLLLTWVHLQRYDALLEAGLLLWTVGLCIALGIVAAWRMSQRVGSPLSGRAGPAGLPILVVGCLLSVLGGCDRPHEPEEIWLRTGRGPGQVVYPRGIAIDRVAGSIFVVDRVGRIQRLDDQGRVLNEWTMPQTDHGLPVGLTVGPDGLVWVPDTHYHRIIVYTPTGEEVLRFGERGHGPGQFIYPTDVAFDERGLIYVSEYGDNDRIQVFQRDGNSIRHVRTIGRFGHSEGSFSRPQSLLIRDGLLYVTDACNHRIQVFGLDGQYLRQIGRVGSGPGEFRFPYGLDMDAQGRLIVCEFGNNRVQRIDPVSGKGLGVWGVGGRAPGELAYPWGVAVDKRGRVIVVDAGNNRLQVFRF